MTHPSYRQDFNNGTRYREPGLRTRDERPVIIGSNFDQVHDAGDYVAQRLLPAMLDRSDRPLKVVMNYGTLYLEDSHLYPDALAISRSGGGTTRASSNAVIYNAPGCTMAIGKSSTSLPPMDLAPVYANNSNNNNNNNNISSSSRSKRYVDLCRGCFKRQFVDSSGYCVECDYFVPSLSERGLILDGIRHVRGLGNMGERDRRRPGITGTSSSSRHRGWERRDRGLQRRYSLSGYHSDSDSGLY
ncbi:hypothetical protein B0T17DRAFT_615240 [Bombardia bombarda]|uniref:Uncharacterized protein n=1 Tax=Bombardia bombarda TaxID=252184 RepID=A0AA39X8V5_9PEZI|nr:hypothetical protein B0T17DRAFT_615240 [Bombardia bombarda]